MDSKISLKIIFGIFSIFIVHLFLYFISPSYGNYFKNMKHEGTEINWNDNVNNNEKSIKGVSNYTWSKFVMADINEDTNSKKDDLEDIEYEVASENNDKVIKNNYDDLNEESSEKDNDENINSNSVKEEVINLFEEFDLKEKEETQNSSLFWLTNEYPYEYEEYYSREKKMNFYFFKEKEYKDILNIFEVISYNLFFKIKKVNNFWEKSFYINLDQDLDDNYIRFVFSYKNNNFGLKIKKDWYNDVKNILKGISK